MEKWGRHIQKCFDFFPWNGITDRVQWTENIWLCFKNSLIVIYKQILIENRIGLGGLEFC